jgi:cysteinyl-tRNA synthetase
MMLALLCHLALTGYAAGGGETTQIMPPQDAGRKDDLDHTRVLTITPVATIYLPIPLNTRSAPMPLADVTYWAYQIQDISRPGVVDALVTSHYDMLVLEPTRTDWSSDDKYFDAKEMVTRLKNSKASDGPHNKLIIAYSDIGEAEDWRWYWTWSKDWDCQGDPPADWPDYILACDPDGWTGNYPVAYWDPGWKDIIIYGQNQGSHPDRDYYSVIDEVIKDGFDGIYLDWVEGFENEAVIAAAQASGKDPASEMIAFIQDMRTYAAARDPNFIIIQQNAAALIDGHPELPSRIDAIAQEAIWYDGDATDDWSDPDGYDWVNDSDLTSYYVGYLNQYLNAGLPVFNCEYALSYANTAYTKSIDKGYVPYVTRRSLSRLTTTPPPGY